MPGQDGLQLLNPYYLCFYQLFYGSHCREVCWTSQNKLNIVSLRGSDHALLPTTGRTNNIREHINQHKTTRGVGEPD